MQTTGAGGAIDPGSATKSSSTSVLGGFSSEDFINMMIVELQNQDPLNPMDNAQILQQISQIQSVETTQRLSDTLSAVLLGQNLSSASLLIGMEVRGMTDVGKEVAGTVDRVSIEGSVPWLVVGEDRLRLSGLREVRGAELPFIFG